MSPPGYDERRPQAGAAPYVEAGRPNDSTTVPRAYDTTGRARPVVSGDVGAQLARRRRASLRCAPLAAGVRDPLGSRDDRRSPSSFGMRTGELLAEVERCGASGWGGWELRERFTNPRAAVTA